MQRIKIQPRHNWQQKIEQIGFTFHSQGAAYWTEDACYRFNGHEINKLEEAAQNLYGLCLEAVQHVIDNNLYHLFHIPQHIIPFIEKSWEEEHPSVYGRFDLAYDGYGQIKMLEFNADTPTSLFESAVVQWYWLQELFPEYDQFNSIHEKLIDKWKELKQYLKSGPLYFSGLTESMEDLTTVEYLRDCAVQAGLDTKFIAIEDIGWDFNRQQFIDLENKPITNIFKLYPWEWMVHEEFGMNLSAAAASTYWIETAWKMILSNKAILPVLWKLFPNHPNLLPAFFERPSLMNSFVKKPLLSREGANITLVKNNSLLESSEGEYGEEGYIFQEYFEIPQFDNLRPVIGSWLIDGQPAGMGIRETTGYITGNTSRFVPHYF